MAIYRIKLFALNEGEHKEENDRKYCIDNNIFAIGWGNNYVSTFEEYQNALKGQGQARRNAGLSGQGMRLSRKPVGQDGRTLSELS